MSKTEVRYDVPQVPPHDIRYVLTEKMGEVTEKGTIISVWFMTPTVDKTKDTSTKERTYQRVKPVGLPFTSDFPI